MRWGGVSYVFLCVCLTGIASYIGEPVPAVELGVALPLTFVGAGFPDIDHHSAKPHRYLRKGVFVVSSGITAYLFLAEARSLNTPFVDVSPILFTAVVGTVSSLVVGAVASYSVAFFRPRHRGVTHTFPAGASVALVVGAGVSTVVPEVAPGLDAVALGGAAALGFVIGFGSHLQCDGMLLSRLPSC